jgi:hypothetical protein
MPHHFDFIENLAFSPNGKIIAATSGRIVELWTVETEAEWRIMCRLSGTVLAVTFSPTGDMLASGSQDGTVRLWHVDSGEECGILWDRPRHSSSVAFSRDGTLLGSVSDNSVVQIWSLHTSELLHTICDARWIHWLKFSPNGRIVTTNRSADWLPLLAPATAAAANAPPDLSYTLAVTDQWLTCDLENVLWILPQYRTEVVATSDQAIGLGLRTGEFNFSVVRCLTGTTMGRHDKSLSVESWD